MKKLLIAALIYVPMSLLAQTTRPATPPAGKPADGEKSGKEVRYVPESIYGDVIVATINNNGNVSTSIRVDFGRDLTQQLTDKDLVNQIDVWRGIQFTNVADAVNYMSAQGFRLVTTYTTNGPLGVDTHLLLEKKISKRGAEPTAGPQRPPQGTADPATRPAPTTRPTDDGKSRPKE